VTFLSARAILGIIDKETKRLAKVQLHKLDGSTVEEAPISMGICNGSCNMSLALRHTQLPPTSVPCFVCIDHAHLVNKP
jgi:hypothetical protein